MKGLTMPALPPDNTQRLFLDYLVGGHIHTLQSRGGVGVLVDDMTENMADFVSAIGPDCYLTTVVSARYAAAGTNVSNEIAWPGPATWGADAGPQGASAYYFDFVGRSNDGRRVRASVFGARYAISADGNFRQTAAESANVGNALDALDTSEGTFLSISGLQPVWKRYANIGENAYWRNKIR